MKAIKFSFDDVGLTNKSADDERYRWVLNAFGAPGAKNQWYSRLFVTDSYRYGPRNKYTYNTLKRTYYFRSEKQAAFFAIKWD